MVLHPSHENVEEPIPPHSIVKNDFILLELDSFIDLKRTRFVNTACLPSIFPLAKENIVSRRLVMSDVIIVRVILLLSQALISGWGKVRRPRRIIDQIIPNGAADQLQYV